MNEFMFGAGRGHLSARVAKAAAKTGADLVNYTDPGCSCGWGCRGECPSNRRHWFAARNLGDPFDSEQARETMVAVRAAATKRDRQHMGLDE